MFFVIALVSAASAGVIPFASYAIAPVASSYSAHTINHAVATPVVAAAPLVASAPLLTAAHAPLVAAPGALAYSAYPYASYLG